MRHQCPTCRRTFGEPGFCPFDRGVLVAVSEQPTIVSEVMQAAAMPPTRLQTDAHTKVDAPKPTLPLTRTEQPSIHPPLPPITAGESTTNVRHVNAISAMGNAQAALAGFTGQHRDEYEQLIGQTLDGRYYIDKKIGEGGMGMVFAARHAVIERPLAIKVLKREVMRDAGTIRRFEQEAKAASRIGHPNIVDVTDFGTTPTGMTYQVMEFVQGQTLGSALRKSSPFPLTRAVRVAIQIARALGAAHDKGIVHRDLKPENVFLLDRDNRPDFVKILDFGIAKVLPLEGSKDPLLPRLTRAGSVFGTPEYMAPEQAAGKNDTDGRVDIYALGILLYEMTTGRVPHRGDTMVRTLAMQMLDPIEPPSKVRPDLAIAPEFEALIMRALAKKREQRYQKMSELVDALDKLQVPVGLSITGSPVYALVPLPPGADLAAPVTQPATQNLLPRPAGPITDAALRRPRSPTSRRLHEPEFMTRDKPLTFEHVFVEDTAALHARRWPLLVLLALLLGGTGGALALVMKNRQRRAVEPAPPVAVIVDAGTIPAGPDASTLIALATGDVSDAGVDADPGALAPPIDAGTRPTRPPRDAEVQAIATPGKRLRVQVMTKPDGGDLYIGGSFAGPDGTWIEQTAGVRVVITCKKIGHEQGRIAVTFDGKVQGAICVLARDKICIPGIKNPFDNCPD